MLCLKPFFKKTPCPSLGSEIASYPPTIIMLLIGKNSSIGSNTTIDRAVFDSTIVGEFSNIDNLVQIAHNVKIGKHAIIAAQVGIAGSTEIGNYVKIGGQAGIAGHLNIGDYVTIAGKSGVTKNIESKKIVA